MRRQDTYAKIMKGKYVVYAEIREARDLIAGLLTLDPTKRLGCGATGVAAVREHAWFGKGGFTWEAMAERKLSPPHKPVATAESDASNFEMEDDDEVRSPPPFLLPKATLRLSAGWRGCGLRRCRSWTTRRRRSRTSCSSPTSTRSSDR